MNFAVPRDAGLDQRNNQKQIDPIGEQHHQEACADAFQMGKLHSVVVTPFKTRLSRHESRHHGSLKLMLIFVDQIVPTIFCLEDKFDRLSYGPSTATQSGHEMSSVAHFLRGVVNCDPEPQSLNGR